MMTICDKCETENNEKNKFCTNCGKDLKEENELWQYYKVVVNKLQLVDPLMMPSAGWLLDIWEAKTIPGIIIPTSRDNQLFKYLLYFGYIIRKEESTKYGKNIMNNRLSQLNDKITNNLEETLKKIANYLDESEIVGFGKNIQPFLILNEKKLSRFFNSVLQGFCQQHKIKISSDDETKKEVMLRNMFWGYSLRVAYEAVEANSSQMLRK